MQLVVVAAVVAVTNVFEAAYAVEPADAVVVVVAPENERMLLY